MRHASTQVNNEPDWFWIKDGWRGGEVSNSLNRTKSFAFATSKTNLRRSTTSHPTPIPSVLWERALYYLPRGGDEPLLISLMDMYMYIILYLYTRYVCVCLFPKKERESCSKEDTTPRRSYDLLLIGVCNPFRMTV